MADSNICTTCKKTCWKTYTCECGNRICGECICECGMKKFQVEMLIDIIVTYVNHVGDNEGIDFIDRMEDGEIKIKLIELLLDHDLKNSKHLVQSLPSGHHRKSPILPT